ncbi:hypothetical protein IE81DRAFT_295827, partial [Ceraceosorus guamensis]
PREEREMTSDALDSDNACHPRACALQSCMQKHLDQDKCSEQVKDLYRCCGKFYARHGPSAEVDACPLLHVVQRKLKGFGEEGLLHGVQEKQH